MDEKEKLITEEGETDEEIWLPEASDGMTGGADDEGAADARLTDAYAAAHSADGTSGGRLRFTARIDQSEREVELAAGELPQIYEKAVNHDRAVARLSELEKKLEESNYSDIKRDLYKPEAVGRSEPKRDFHAELDELLKLYPDALASGGLPEEVRRAAAGGRNVTLAYMDYRLRQTEAENRALRQNIKNAGMAPVRGNGGAASGGDDFLRGFDSEFA
jgi:tetrahydromethanopterin S-methyltransferase subunit G